MGKDQGHHTGLEKSGWSEDTRTNRTQRWREREKPRMLLYWFLSFLQNTLTPTFLTILLRLMTMDSQPLARTFWLMYPTAWCTVYGHIHLGRFRWLSEPVPAAVAASHSAVCILVDSIRCPLTLPSTSEPSLPSLIPDPSDPGSHGNFTAWRMLLKSILSSAFPRPLPVCRPSTFPLPRLLKPSPSRCPEFLSSDAEWSFRRLRLVLHLPLLSS